MARLQRKDMANPDEVREFPGGSRVEIFQLEDVVVGRTVWLPGWRWSEVVTRGTRLTNFVELDPAGPLGLLGGVFAGRIQASVAENLAALRTLLEGGGA